MATSRALRFFPRWGSLAIARPDRAIRPRGVHEPFARGDADVSSSFLHRSGGGGGAGQAAKDATGADIKSKVWLKTHLPGDHTLSQGLKVRVAAPHRIHRGGSRRARGLARAPSRASEPNRDVDRGVSPPEAWIRHRSGNSVFRQSATFVRGMTMPVGRRSKRLAVTHGANSPRKMRLANTSRVFGFFSRSARDGFGAFSSRATHALTKSERFLSSYDNRVTPRTSS
jgi:hypothetical protein